jgi:uncharacterized protein
MEPMIWDEKPYYSLNYFLKNQYGEKIYKLSLNGGMTCPNRDGTLGSKGCIFCSEGGSGEFAASKLLPIKDQIERQKKTITKYVGNKFIAYFQAYTNTYAPISYLREIFYEAITHPDIVILSIATRPDCLNDEVLSLLDELNHIKPVWIELGLQTIHESSAKFIRRGYSLPTFDKAVFNLRSLKIAVIVHTILGLPNETSADMLATIHYLSNLDIQGIKLQLLHVLKNTDLETYYKENTFEVLTFQDYIDIVIKCIEALPQNIVIHRLTGDGPRNLLVAPSWSSSKTIVLNTIHRELKIRNSWQGKAL